MRKLVYFPEHIRDRLMKFRQRHEMMDEQVAIIRLVDAGLRADENTELPKQQTNGACVTADKAWPWYSAWPTWKDFYK